MRNCRLLRKLDLSHCAITGYSFVALKTEQKQQLRQKPAADAGADATLASAGLPHLHFLNLSGCSKLNQRALFALMKMAPRLEALFINNDFPLQLNDALRKLAKPHHQNLKVYACARPTTRHDQRHDTTPCVRTHQVYAFVDCRFGWTSRRTSFHDSMVRWTTLFDRRYAASPAHVSVCGHVPPHAHPLPVRDTVVNRRRPTSSASTWPDACSPTTDSSRASSSHVPYAILCPLFPGRLSFLVL
jgi:hypothetical protein